MNKDLLEVISSRSLHCIDRKTRWLESVRSKIYVTIPKSYYGWECLLIPENSGAFPLLLDSNLLYDFEEVTFYLHASVTLLLASGELTYPSQGLSQDPLRKGILPDPAAQPRAPGFLVPSKEMFIKTREYNTTFHFSVSLSLKTLFFFFFTISHHS